MILEFGGSTIREKATTTSTDDNNWSIIDTNTMDEPTYEDIYWMERDDDDEEKE